MRSFVIAVVAIVLIVSASLTNARSTALGVVPEVTGANLLKRSITLPSGLDGDHNLLLVAFVREQQEDINTWLDATVPIAESRELFEVYEIPTIGPMSSMMKWIIDNGMRSGIPSDAQRRRTITIYEGKSEFMDGLGNLPEDRIYALLVDRSGAVLWRAEGIATSEKLAQFEAALDAAQRR